MDLNDLASQITTPPNSILGTNAKMAKSKKEGAIRYAFRMLIQV